MSCGKKRLWSLPAIPQPAALDNDSYSKSKLMTYTCSRERQKVLNNIMLVFFIFHAATLIQSLFIFVE